MNYVMVAVVYAAICMKSVNETLPILYINVALLARRRVLPLVSCVAYVSGVTDDDDRRQRAKQYCPYTMYRRASINRGLVANLYDFSNE